MTTAPSLNPPDSAGILIAELLRNIEERWGTLLAHIEEVVILVNANGVVTYVSPAARRWLGYEHEELIGQSMTEITHEEDASALERAFAASDGPEVLTLKHRVRAENQSWRWFESTFVALHHDRDFAATLVTARDITAEVELEEERERLELERRVSQRLEAVGQLSAGIAHEINTPLQFVGDSVAFLGQAVDDLLTLIAQYRDALFVDTAIPVAERRSLMKEAEEAADIEYLLERIPGAFTRTADGIERVRSIVQAMKRFSHTGGGDAAHADLNEALETTLAVCRNEYKYVAEVEFRPGELPPVTCNISELNQVFLNVILNAAQAIAEQGRDSSEMGTIEIETRREGDRVVVRIADDGPGIPLELQDRIYEPFFTTKEVGKGTGQGLALARITIERHAGSLECVSLPGQGTTFTIRLPIQRPRESARPVL